MPFLRNSKFLRNEKKNTLANQSLPNSYPYASWWNIEWFLIKKNHSTLKCLELKDFPKFSWRTDECRFIRYFQVFVDCFTQNTVFIWKTVDTRWRVINQFFFWIFSFVSNFLSTLIHRPNKKRNLFYPCQYANAVLKIRIFLKKILIHIFNLFYEISFFSEVLILNEKKRKKAFIMNEENALSQ